jgi:uncharacterized protein (TIGR03083 family)
VTVAGFYQEGREQLLALAAALTEDDAATAVPTCPEWTVKDVYAHQAGVPADIIAGRLEGVATDEWTARQIATRTDRSFAEVVAELAEAGAQLDLLLEAAGDAVDRRLVIDQWTHEQDVRGALGRPGSRDVGAVGFAVATMVRGFGRSWPALGLAPVRVVGSSGEWMLGDGEPVATMRATDFELARVLVGRRSRAQALSIWEGDGEPFVDHLVAFQFSLDDIDEP